MTSELPAVAGLTPARIGQRVTARLLDALLGVIGIVVAVMLIVGGAPAGIGILILLAIAVGPLIVIGACAATPGGLLVGLRNVDVRTGEPAGGRTLGKYLLEALVGIITAGLGSVLLFSTIRKPLGRHLFDRLAGVMVIDRRRPPQGRPAGGLATSVAAAPPVNLIVAVGSTPQAAPVAPVTAGPATPAEPSGGFDPGTIITSVPGRPARPPAEPGRLTEPQPAARPQQVPVAGPAQDLDDLQDRTFVDPEVGASTPELVLEDGRRFALCDLVVLGRHPAAPRGYDGAVLVAVEDPDMSISKTHVAVSMLGDTVVLRDLKSTNGTRFRVPGGEWQVADPGQGYELPAGSIVRFGRRSFEVVR